MQLNFIYLILVIFCAVQSVFRSHDGVLKSSETRWIVFVCMIICMSISTHKCIYTYIDIYKYTYIYIYTYNYIYTNVSIYICMYVYIHTHIHI